MDIYSGKKVVDHVPITRNEMRIAFPDGRIGYSNFPGPGTRSTIQVDNTEQLKSTRPFSTSRSRKATVGSTSGTIPIMSDKRKTLPERQSTQFLQERGTPASSSRQEEVEDFECNIRQQEMVNSRVCPRLLGSHTVLPTLQVPEPSPFQVFSMNVNEASQSCQLRANSGIHRPRYPVPGSANQDASISSVRHSVLPRVSDSPRPSQNQVTSAYRYGMRNLSCTSISTVLPTGCSSDFSHGKRPDVVRIDNNGGSSSRSRGTMKSSTGRSMDTVEGSVRGKGIIRSPTEGRQGSHRNGPSGANRFIFSHSMPHPTLRTRNHLADRDGSLLVQNQREGNECRTRLFEHISDNRTMLPEPVAFSSSFQAQLSPSEVASSSSPPLQSFSTGIASMSQSSSGLSGSMGRSIHIRNRTDSEVNNVGGFSMSEMHRESNQWFNMDGIAEVLSALERIEQDNVLAYEELMVLESNLFFGGIGSYDRYRDMRMNIDNMSYEELLALEEKMGSVSTALTEEALSTCLQRSLYLPVMRSGNAYGDDNVKCSICQEEYNVRDEVGKLNCGHCYHVSCIHQWLRRKNWCPICKSPACHSSPSKPNY